MSALGMVGVALVVLGTVMVMTAAVRARRADLRAPAPVNPLSEQDLSVGQSHRLARAAQGRSPMPAGGVKLVRALARAEAGAPAPSVVGALGAGLALTGVGAVFGVSLLGALWLVPAVAVASLPWQMRRRRARARAVLAALPPEDSDR